MRKSIVNDSTFVFLEGEELYDYGIMFITTAKDVEEAKEHCLHKHGSVMYEWNIFKLSIQPIDSKTCEDRPTREPIRIREDRSEPEPPPPPERPLGRVLRVGLLDHLCENCSSTCGKSGFLGLFGKRLCDNKECPNSKK